MWGALAVLCAMRVGELLVRTLLLGDAPASSSAAAAAAASPVFVTLRPLVDGPKFLPVHVQVATTCDTDGTFMIYDFLPSDPSSPNTAKTLLRGGATPGNIRRRKKQALRTDAWKLLGQTTRSSDEIDAFVSAQPSELSLLSNSCWTFAAALVDFCEVSRE